MRISEMDVFNYFLTFSSIILGLGTTCLLDGLSKLIQTRKIIKIYWVHLIWILIIFLLQLEYWWSQWRFASSAHDWTLLMFVVHILPIICLFLMSDLIIPDSFIEQKEDFKLDIFFYSNIRRWLFILITIYLVSAGIQQVLIGNERLLSLNNAYRSLSVCLSLSLYASKNRLFHSAFAVVALFILLSYILTFSFKPLAALS